MTTMLPVEWREGFENLRGRVTGLVDRWKAPLLERARQDDHYLPGFMISRLGPEVDIVEKDDEIAVTAEMPGLDKGDFNVEISGDRLVLRGEKRSSRESKDGSYYRAECSYGSFFRAVPLPCEIDADKVKANYRRGVLTVRLPKTEAAKRQSVRVKVN